MCFYACVVSVHFTGSSLLVVTLYRKVFTHSTSCIYSHIHTYLWHCWSVALSPMTVECDRFTCDSVISCDVQEAIRRLIVSIVVAVIAMYGEH